MVLISAGSVRARHKAVVVPAGAIRSNGTGSLPPHSNGPTAARFHLPTPWTAPMCRLESISARQKPSSLIASSTEISLPLNGSR